MHLRMQDKQNSLGWHAQLLPLWFSRSKVIAHGWCESIRPVTNGVSDLPAAQQFLHHLTEQVIALLLDEGFDRDGAQAIGAALAERFWEPQVMAKSQQALSRLLLEGVSETQAVTLRPRVTELLSEMTVGFIEEKERALRRGHRTFLSHMRHELGTPLTAITGFTYIMLQGMDGALSDLQIKDIRAIQEAGQHLIDILNDISDISKMEMGRLRFQPQRFEVQPMIETVVASVQDVLGKNGNRLTLQADSSLGTLHSDKKKLERLLRCLLTQANWSTREGEITLAASHTMRNGATWLHLCVTDTGSGLTPQQVEEMGTPSSADEFCSALELGGPGLALLLSQRLSQIMGGHIEVSSELGKGSTYYCWLPAEPKL